MSRADHPSYTLDCCRPWLRGPTPSGRMERVHSFACKVSPNKLVEPPPRRAEVSSRFARHETDVDLIKERRAYAGYWGDLAYELQEGK